MADTRYHPSDVDTLQQHIECSLLPASCSCTILEGKGGNHDFPLCSHSVLVRMPGSLSDLQQAASFPLDKLDT